MLISIGTLVGTSIGRDIEKTSTVNDGSLQYSDNPSDDFSDKAPDGLPISASDARMFGFDNMPPNGIPTAPMKHSTVLQLFE